MRILVSKKQVEHHTTSVREFFLVAKEVQKSFTSVNIRRPLSEVNCHVFIPRSRIGHRYDVVYSNYTMLQAVRRLLLSCHHIN